MWIRICTIVVALLIWSGAWPSAIHAQNVTFPDANLRAKLEQITGKSPGATFTSSEVAGWTSLDLNNSNISDITGLQHATGLTTLLLWNNNISDLSALRGLTSLQALNLGNNNITDISPLRHLTNLEHYLTLSNNNITNLDSLSTLTNLDVLSLNGNVNLSDLSPLSTLNTLESLNIYVNPLITDISPVANLTALRFFDARWCNISDISALQNLVYLNVMDLNGNRITDLSPLLANPGVGRKEPLDRGGDRVRIYANPLSATARNTQVPALEAKGAINVYVSPIITLSLSSSAIDENSATPTTITATLDEAHGTYPSTITVSVAPGANAVAGDFALSNNPVLTIAVGATTSTGTVTVTAVDDAFSSGDKTVTISATVLNRVLRTTGQAVPDVTPPLPVTLTILDDEVVATLVLSPSYIDESGATNQATVTATLNRASSAATTITVSAAPDANAVAGDFALSNNPVLTIAAGATTSTGTVTITAVDDAVSSPAKLVTVSGNVQSASVISISDVTLTIRDDDVPVEAPRENRVPEFTDAVDFQRYYQGTPIPLLTFPRATDGDGPLTYALESPPPLPPGLTYTPPSEEDAHGGVLAGTPTEVMRKTLYTLTATDDDEDGAQASFFIVVMADTSSVVVDRMPSFGDTVAAQRYVQNREIEAITLPQATGGDGALTYALTPDLPEGLSFTAETRVLSGLPTEAIDETTYTLTATDGDGDEATLGFAIAVAEDLMPSFADTIVGAYRFLVKTDVEITFPEATGGDGTLAYIILPLLPDELQFDHEARRITGTLLRAILETEYALSALDADGDVASLVFTLEGLTPDFDGNGWVNFADFALFVGRYGTRRGEERYNHRYDLNSDGVVGYGDFLIFSAHYNTEI